MSATKLETLDVLKLDGESQFPSLNNDGSPTISDSDDNGSDVKIHHDLSLLPAPVARMRELIIKAAKTGDIENLRALFGVGETTTQLSINGIDGDPIEFLKTLSGGKEGYEILAILLDIFEAGYVHFDRGTPNEMYSWPYFYAVALEKLTPVQKVDLFRIITTGDYADMLEFGGYIFYRVGITPDGQWKFFITGD